MKLLVAYATRNGSTAEVAAFLCDKLHEHSVDATLSRAGEVEDVRDYDAFLLGTSIYNGMWLPEMIAFVGRFSKDIAQKPVFGWVSCIRVLENSGYEYVMRNYLPIKTLSRLNVQDYKVFAGKLDLEDINWRDSWALSLTYDGQTPPNQFDGDFRDWDAMSEWAQRIAKRLGTNTTPTQT